MPGATSASVAKRVCPHCCKSVCAYMLQSEPYSARHTCARCTARHSVCKACVSKMLQSVWAYLVAVGAVQCPGPLLPGGLRLRDGPHMGHTRIQGTVRNADQERVNG